MQLLPLSTITYDPDRYRHDLDLDALVDSIQRYGIIQPLILDENNVLIDGGRRLAAAIQIGLTDVPIVYRVDVPETLRRELELESNMCRKDFTWQEQVAGVCTVHRTHTREAALRGEAWSLEKTGAIVGGFAPSFVHYCLKLEPSLKDEELAKCDTVTEAVRLLYRRKADEAMAELARRHVASQPAASDPAAPDDITRLVEDDGAVISVSNETATREVSLSQMLHLGDCREILAGLPPACCDHIITDPPYAIDMAMLDQDNIGGSMARVEDTHEVEENLTLLEAIWPDLNRVLRPGGYAIFWCDLERWHWLAGLAGVYLTVQRWPFIWCKTSPCKNGAPHYNFTKNFESALICRKGNATLPTPVLTSWIVTGALGTVASNPFAKPFEVWRRLIENVSLVGQIILDPFAGEGTCPLAALRLGRRIIAVEKDEKHYNYMLESVKQHYAGATFV